MSLSQNEIFILAGFALLFGVSVAFAIISMTRVPEMKKQLPGRIALIAIMEALCLTLIIFALLVFDL